MRTFSTITLILLTAALSGWLALHLSQEKIDRYVSYSKARPAGTPLFDQSKIAQTVFIELSNPANEKQRFQITRNGIWQCTTPYQDRADWANHLQPLTVFTQGAEVIDSMPLDSVNLADYGLDDQWIRVRFEDRSQSTLLSYKIGISSSWRKRHITTDEKNQQTITDIPTVFIIKENTSDDQTLYLVSDVSLKLHQLFQDNFSGFRDHRPFALNLYSIEQLRIKQGSREIIIDHSTAESPWRISKPLDLAIDKKAIQQLIVGISQLKAVKVHDKDSITLPEATANSTEQLEIAVKYRYTDDEITLTVYPHEPTAITTFATISDRPGVIFELPIKPSQKFKATITNLPFSINQLRRKNMLNLNRSNIRGFIIRNEIDPPIIVSRSKLGTPYQLLAIDGTVRKVNEIAVTNLIAAISVAPVKGFVSDAATDLSLYNFHNPSLSIVIRPLAGVPRKITFARKDGHIYATEKGNSVVWEVEPDIYAAIPKKEWAWKDNLLWNFLINDITGFSIARPGNPITSVDYDYLGDTFTCTVGVKDLSSKLNPLQAKYILNNSHILAAQKRLGPHHRHAKKALENPILIATIRATDYDHEGLPKATPLHKVIRIAPPTPNAKHPAYYYAKIDGQEDYLIIPASIYHTFNINLFSEE